ncbi:MAG: GntR family transcriptional regulator [Nitrospirae bacterium]|nr:GntR family transcriptional regulator [Nitrospirota bacterium]
MKLHNKTVDRFTQEKLYIQLTRILLEEISAGRWQPGDRIPSEEQLCKAHGVSKITVRQALQNLSSEGYLLKVQGKGTFVTGVSSEGCLAMRTRFTEEMFGKEVKGEKATLFKGIKLPPEDAGGYLKTREETYYILNKRMVDGKPVCLEESFIPYRLVPGIEKLDFSRHSLYSLLQEKGAKKIFKVVQTIQIARVQRESAKHLELRIKVPVLVVHRLFLSSDNTPVAYTRFIGRSDRYKFQTEFEKLR